MVAPLPEGRRYAKQNVEYYIMLGNPQGNHDQRRGNHGETAHAA